VEELEFLPEQPQNPQEERCRVLYVEDDKFCAEAMRRIFDRHGIEIDWAPGVLEGIVKLGNNDYDFVLIDYNMPLYTGDVIADAVDAVSGFDLPDFTIPNLVALPELLGPGEGKSGLQKALPYNLDFLPEEDSLALAILSGRAG